MSLQVAGDICELFKLCSTKQLEGAKDFTSKIDKKKHGCHDDKCDGHKDKSSVTMAMEQLSVSDNSLTIHNDQCTNDGHHGNSERDTLEMDDRNDIIVTDTIVTDTMVTDDGWDVVKRKKR